MARAHLLGKNVVDSVKIYAKGLHLDVRHVSVSGSSVLFQYGKKEYACKIITGEHKTQLAQLAVKSLQRRLSSVKAHCAMFLGDEAVENISSYVLVLLYLCTKSIHSGFLKSYEGKYTGFVIEDDFTIKQVCERFLEAADYLENPIFPNVYFTEGESSTDMLALIDAMHMDVMGDQVEIVGKEADEAEESPPPPKPKEKTPNPIVVSDDSDTTGSDETPESEPEPKKSRKSPRKSVTAAAKETEERLSVRLSYSIPCEYTRGLVEHLADMDEDPPEDALVLQSPVQMIDRSMKGSKHDRIFNVSLKRAVVHHRRHKKYRQCKDALEELEKATV